MVQIPCLNEAETLPLVLRDIPKHIDHVDEIEVVVIDDGSTDGTSEVARENGVHHIVRFAANRGLGYAFAAGIDYCLSHGADIIVNTDGDNQYHSGDIPKLVAPIIEGRAEIVIGDREPDKVAHFSAAKKRMQKLGSRVVSQLAGLEVPDVASGFKAYSRDAASMVTMSTDFDHTVDHVIQAGRKRIPTVSVPIRTNEKLRESRLFSSPLFFVTRSLEIMTRVYASYRAMRVFTAAGLLAFTGGFLLGLRFLWIFLFTEHSQLHVQSLILAAILMLAGFQIVLTGIVADLISANRSLLEDVSRRIRRVEDGEHRLEERKRESAGHHDGLEKRRER